MVSAGEVVIGVLVGAVGVWGASRLATTVRAYLAVRGVAPDSAPALRDGETVALEGTVAVEEPAVAADRLFGEGSGVGGYAWRGGVLEWNRENYDSHRGGLREGGGTLASGAGAGWDGAAASGRGG